MKFIASLDTKVDVGKTIHDIQKLVERFGAAEFTTTYDRDRNPRGVRFKVENPEQAGTLVTVELTAPSDKIYRLVQDARNMKVGKTGQHERIAWRNLHDFVRASLIGVQTGMMTLPEAFMASVLVTLPNGSERRLGDVAREGGLLQPAAGGRLLLRGGE